LARVAEGPCVPPAPLRGASLFDYLHSQDFLSLSDLKFEDIIGENTVSDIAAGGRQLASTGY
jgi:hypothetical protein